MKIEKIWTHDIPVVDYIAGPTRPRTQRGLRSLAGSTGDNTDGYDSVPLNTSSVWRGEVPEITVTTSTTWNEP